MPLFFELPKDAEIEVLGVVLKAEKQCRFSLDDHAYKFLKPTDTEPRRIVRTEAAE